MGLGVASPLYSKIAGQALATLDFEPTFNADGKSARLADVYQQQRYGVVFGRFSADKRRHIVRLPTLDEQFRNAHPRSPLQGYALIRTLEPPCLEHAWRPVNHQVQCQYA